MTSPSQLQYLKAMGIPVWVSRELVIDEALETVTPSVETFISAEAPTSAQNAAEKSVSNSGVSNAVESILQDLEQEDKKPRAGNNTAVTKPEIVHPEKVADAPIKQTPVNIPPSLNTIAKTEQHTVYAQGSLDADWMIIGQTPEFVEHESGQPYSGEEGILLENMIRAVGISNPRHDAYLVNVLRNSQQNDTDVAKSKSELNKILKDCIMLVSPKIIIIVGQLAAQNILHSEEPLARLRGKSFTLPNSENDEEISVVVTYYPSYLLSKPMDKRKAWDDLKLAMNLIAE